MIDKLSGLLERKPFIAKFDEEVKRAVRYHRAVSVLMIDLDYNHFSKDRDVRWSLGYSLLKQVAAVLKSGLRDIDVLARFEGEIFSAILPETDLEGAARAAERVRVKVEEHYFMGTQVGDKLRIAVNLGYATFPGHSDDSDVLIELARKAMEKARTDGGNRACEAEKAPSSETPAANAGGTE
jgi:diguanylate cyclase (GGDEF)-like protein